MPKRSLILLASYVFLASCRGPTLMPIAPLSSSLNADGGIARIYDTNGDGKGDYAELLSPSGQVSVLRFDSDNDGTFDLDIVLDQIERSDCRELLIILDSIPERMVQEMWDQGRFRHFYPPSRVISTFPVMTDPALAEFFGVSPCLGVESAYYDGHQLTNAYSVYFKKDNATWMKHLDYRLSTRDHGFVYLWPDWGFLKELRGIEDSFFKGNGKTHVCYSVGTSAQGAIHGRTGHQRALVTLDRFSQAVMHRTQGRVQITLLSDHGHNMIAGKHISLPKELSQLGYHLTRRLEKPGDVVVPEFSVVTCAAIYTEQPAQVAADAAGLEFVDLSCYLNENDEVVVLNRTGKALISRSENRYRYQAQFGDPLQLKPILRTLDQDGKINSDGFIEDRTLFEATAAHVYPDAVHRLWRAFHGLMIHPPDVLISVKEDWYCGSPTISGLITLKAAHGSLHRLSSVGFVMTTAGPLPEHLRMEDLADALRAQAAAALRPVRHHDHIQKTAQTSSLRLLDQNRSVRDSRVRWADHFDFQQFVIEQSAENSFAVMGG